LPLLLAFASRLCFSPLLLAFAVLLSQRIIRAGVITKRLSDVLQAAGFFEVRNSPQLIYIPAAFFR
jgi:hypothetical protein